MDTEEFDAVYKKGQRLVDEQILLNKHLSNHDLFRLCWKVIDANQHMFTGRAEASGRNPKVWRLMVHHDLGKHFARVRPDFVPPVRVLDAPARSAVIITVHTGLELGIGKALVAGNRKLSVIHNPNSQNRERTRLFKLPSTVEYIIADANCLLKARMALHAGRVVLADCDYPAPDDPKASAIRVVSSSLFDLAKRAGAELFFVLPYIDPHGHIAFHSERVPRPLRQDNDYRQNFISFARRSGLDWIEWRISEK